MTSMKSTVGWDANKQTGSNSTYGYIQGGSKVGSREYRHLEEETKSRGRFASGSDSRSSSNSRALKTTPATSPSSSSSLLTGGGGGGGILPPETELSSSTPLDSELDVMLRERELFYKEKYDYMTGVRIASTLGGFFLLVLLTLLYKSKCKGKHSREPSTLTLNSIPYPAPIHPAHLTLMRGQNIQVNGRHHHHDFGGAGDSPGANPPTMTLLDSSCYGYMNQVHPTHQPVFSNCYTSNNTSTGGVEAHIKSPAVLLITAANSESSDEELSELVSERVDVIRVGGPEEPPPPVDRRRTKNPLGPLPPCRQVLGDDLNPRSKSPPRMHHLGGRGNIDINVILPTPSISPSGSENFNLVGGQYFGGGGGNLLASRGGGSASSAAGGGRGRLLVSRSLSSDNENDQSEISGGGGDASECSSGSDTAAAMALAFGCGNSSLFSLDNLKYVDDTSSENIPTRASDVEDADDKEDTRSIGSDSVFACFEHNFDHIAPTYARRVSSVSGTSSGVLVVHSPNPGASPVSRHHPHYYRHHHISPHPPPAPQPASPPVHSPPAVVSEFGRVCRAASSSGFCEGTTEEASDFRVTLTQAHAQVHHRDSFCSDLESVNDYMETGARRRSSSTQTTLSDLRQALGYSAVMIGWNTPGENTGGATSPGTISLTSTQQHSVEISTRRRLSVPRRRRSLSPHLNSGVSAYAHLALSPRNSTPSSSPACLPVTLHAPPPQPPTCLPLVTTTSSSTNTDNDLVPSEGQIPVTPITPTNPPPPTVVLSPSSPFIPPRVMRKRSFDAVRKTLSLQCEDKMDLGGLYVGSSNETTPTN